jgi:hypothetical protein
LQTHGLVACPVYPYRVRLAGERQAMAEKSDVRAEEVLARLEVDLERLKEAFGLLGVSACSWCNKFLRRSDPGALFDAGELVCYGCIREWWPHRCAELSNKDRENLEGKLVFWLRDHHHAEMFKDPAKLPESSLQELNIVATCMECHGTGKSLGQDHCRYCEDRGTVWVVVSRKKG